MPIQFIGFKTIAISGLLLLTGCGQPWLNPSNDADFNHGGGYMAERASVGSIPTQEKSYRWNRDRCVETKIDVSNTNKLLISNDDIPLSAGDLIQLSLPMNEAPSGNYKVGADGVLSLDILGKIKVSGLNITQAQLLLSDFLVEKGYFKKGHARASIKILDKSSAHVYVNGAVFQPGQTTINQKSQNDRDPLHDSASGDFAGGRSLANALASSGGIRPDADISHVMVKRNGNMRVIDFTGIITGKVVDDIMLSDGDEVSVPSRECFQLDLVRPSSITPPGIRVFISNLTVPANSNATSAIGRDATTFPYGTRFLQGLVSGNCVGGTQSTNAGRYAVLISINPKTQETEVVERAVEDLVRRADRDNFNPVLLPGDAIACYDSKVTNFTDIMKTIIGSLVPKNLVFP